MKKKFWTSDKLLSLTALLVSLFTLIVFIYQTNLIRQQQFMSVYPYLNLSNEYGGTLNYSYVLSNEGIGPAIIETVKITSPKNEVFNDFVDYVNSEISTQDSIWYFHSNLKKGKLIPSNQKINLIQLVNKERLLAIGINQTDNLPTNNINNSRRLYQILNNDSLKVEIIYTSVYGEKWSLKSNTNAPVKLE